MAMMLRRPTGAVAGTKRQGRRPPGAIDINDNPSVRATIPPCSSPLYRIGSTPPPNAIPVPAHLTTPDPESISPALTPQSPRRRSSRKGKISRKTSVLSESRSNPKGTDKKAETELVGEPGTRRRSTDSMESSRARRGSNTSTASGRLSNPDEKNARGNDNTSRVETGLRSNQHDNERRHSTNDERKKKGRRETGRFSNAEANDGLGKRTQEKLTLMAEMAISSNPKTMIIAGNHVWIGLGDGWVQVRDLMSGAFVRQCWTRSTSKMIGVVTCLHYQVGDGVVWIGSSDGSLQSWRDDGSVQIQAPFYAHRGAVRCMAGFNTIIWSAGDDWRLVKRDNRGEATMIVNNGLTWVKTMIVSGIGHLWAGTEEGIRVWTESGSYKGLLNAGHDGAIMALCLTGPNGSELVWSASADGTVAVWRSGDGVLIRRYQNAHKDWIYRIRPVGNDVWSVDVAGSFGIWDSKTGCLRKMTNPADHRLVDLRCRVTPSAPETDRVWLIYRDPPAIKLLTIDRGQELNRSETQLERPLAYALPSKNAIVHPGGKPHRISAIGALHAPGVDGRFPKKDKLKPVRTPSPATGSESSISTISTEELKGVDPGAISVFDDDEGDARFQLKRKCLGIWRKGMIRRKLKDQECQTVEETTGQRMIRNDRDGELKEAKLAAKTAIFQLEAATALADELYAEIDRERNRRVEAETQMRGALIQATTLMAAYHVRKGENGERSGDDEQERVRQELINESHVWMEKYRQLQWEHDLTMQLANDKAQMLESSWDQSKLETHRSQMRLENLVRLEKKKAMKRIRRDHNLWTRIGKVEDYVEHIEQEYGKAVAEGNELRVQLQATQLMSSIDPADMGRPQSSTTNEASVRLRQQTPPALLQLRDITSFQIAKEDE